MDLESGDNIYQVFRDMYIKDKRQILILKVPLDMNVDHIMVLEERGWIFLINTNNMLLSVILDFN